MNLPDLLKRLLMALNLGTSLQTNRNFYPPKGYAILSMSGNHCRAADSQWEMSQLNRLPITIFQKATLPKSSPETPDSKHINPHHTPKFYHATATVAK